MNDLFLTAQLVSWPKQYCSVKGKIITYVILRLPNAKTGKSYNYIYGFATEQKGKELLWYQKGDYIILEGYIILTKSSIYLSNIYIYILNDFPLSLEIE